MAPPAKRRKRNALPSSDSDDDEEPVLKADSHANDLISFSPPLLSPSKTSTIANGQGQAPAASTSTQGRSPYTTTALPATGWKAGRGNRSKQKSASNSPAKPKKDVKREETGRNGDIFTFFTKQVQRQQVQGTAIGDRPKLNPTPPVFREKIRDDDDLISDEENEFGSSAKGASLVGLAARKRQRGEDSFKSADVLEIAPNASAKFLNKAGAIREPRADDDTRPWAERFGPLNLEELAVHKRKVADVRTWLENVIHGRMRQRLLVLKGPAGTGKTTTVQLLAKSMDCDVLEWRNPVGAGASADGFQSMAAQFEEFMDRGGKFGQLDIFSAGSNLPVETIHNPLDRRKQIILIEEFPNTFTRSSTALQSFKSTVLQYLAANTPTLSMYNHSAPTELVTPVVMTISETLLTTTSASADSFTAHRLLGPEILQHPSLGVIEFNAIAPTLLAKALELVVQKEARKSGRRKTPGPLVLRKLGEIGDVRSAIGSLEFLCLKGDVDGTWGSKVAFSKPKKGTKDTVSLTKMEEESLELVSRREASLGIFHAVGKVVYNKRDESEPALLSSHDVENLPDFKSRHARPKRSQVQVDELIDEIGTDTQTFVAALHENYILSCDAPPNSFETTSLDHVNGCINALSDSDLLCPSWDGSFNSTGFGGGVGGRGSGGDILRQDEISFQIAVRGILFSLPFPVKRKAPAAAGLRTGKGGDAFKMFYPSSLRLWRMKEEIEGTIDLWVMRLMRGESDTTNPITAGAAAFARPKPGTVESWKSSRSANAPSSKESTQKDEGGTPRLSLGTSARKEMLLERLPYMVQIAKARRTPTSGLMVKDMEKVTSFHGISGPSETAEDENDALAVGEEWATDKPAEGELPKEKRLVIRGRGLAVGLPSQIQEPKLVLSDDDIEDD